MDMIFVSLTGAEISSRGQYKVWVRWLSVWLIPQPFALVNILTAPAPEAA